MAAPEVTLLESTQQDSMSTAEPMLALLSSEPQTTTMTTNASTLPLVLPSLEPQIAMHSATAPKPTLLGIPRELRDAIYEEVLVPDSPIELSTREPHVEPDFLRVNRQIRDEAIKVYYNQSKFNFTVCAWNSARMKPFLERRAKYEGARKQEKPSVTMCRCDGCKDANVNTRRLEAWFQAVHEDPETFPYPVLAVREGGPQSAQDLVEDGIACVFSVVAASTDRPWEEVQAMLRTVNTNIRFLENYRQDAGDFMAGRPLPLRVSRSFFRTHLCHELCAVVGMFTLVSLFISAAMSLESWYYGVDAATVPCSLTCQILHMIMALYSLWHLYVMYFG